ncbi:MAG: WG repeat-containing protein, partial [candidate division WOR-3 bacterium]
MIDKEKGCCKFIIIYLLLTWALLYGQLNVGVLFPIKQNGKYGFIDQWGRVMIRPKFDQTLGFKDKLAAVCTQGKWGYINTDGEYVISPQYDWAENFSEGLARVMLNKKTYYINKAGKIVIKSKFPESGDFKELLTWVS